ncbi:endonuclease domain-containing protein [Cupriavidus sp. AU9028]|uniref:endonuclease domain-containing protein n=1 Tax=Cupriavidus sp. AU9028 TaxID=2871157 RepID=UPI001C95F840|nr:endonuclease domain-containing protein [Cupriavidus sp. AU9028]MBY4895785.1 endonuclease domain-containing protein [Cupriavidus sp. AU9028]
MASVSTRTYARELRGQLTDAEQRLWYYLRAHRLFSEKFKRQVPVGPYIADFACMRLRLIVEADGAQHADGADAERDAWFRRQGYTVLRFWNNEVLGQTGAVLERIRMEVDTLAALSPNPSPAGGRGERRSASRVAAINGVGGAAGSLPTPAQGRRDGGLLPSPACGRGAGGEGSGARRPTSSPPDDTSPTRA